MADANRYLEQIYLSQYNAEFAIAAAAEVAVRVHCYVNGTLGIFHGPRKLAGYDAQGNLLMQELKKAA